MESIWPVVFIVLAVAMALGPVLIIKPSKRQQRQQYLRQKALELDLRVQMLSLADGQASQTCYVYSWQQCDNFAEHRKSREFQLLRKNYSHELHLADVWQCTNKKDQEGLAQLSEPLAQLPESVLAVIGQPHGLGVVWLEKGGEACLEQLADWLKVQAPRLLAKD